jgi:hypothetical protein
MSEGQRRFPWAGVLIGCSVPTVLVIGVMCAGLIWLGTGPEGGVKLSNEMESYATEYLEQHDILNETETLIAYYDVTISLDSTEAAILTDERVIYHLGGRSTTIPLVDITDVRHRTDPLIGDIIEIDSSTGVPMKIEIAHFNQGETFLNALHDAWERARR